MNKEADRTLLHELMVYWLCFGLVSLIRFTCRYSMYEKSCFKTAHCITKSSYNSRSIPGTNQCWAVRVKFLVIHANHGLRQVILSLKLAIIWYTLVSETKYLQPWIAIHYSLNCSTIYILINVSNAPVIDQIWITWTWSVLN